MFFEKYIVSLYIFVVKEALNLCDYRSLFTIKGALIESIKDRPAGVE